MALHAAARPPEITRALFANHTDPASCDQDSLPSPLSLVHAWKSPALRTDRLGLQGDVQLFLESIPGLL